jgi:hypothetical protein
MPGTPTALRGDRDREAVECEVDTVPRSARQTDRLEGDRGGCSAASDHQEKHLDVCYVRCYYSFKLQLKASKVFPILSVYMR